MRKHVLFLLAAFGLFFATVLVRAAHSAVNVPFAGHSFTYAAHIKPNTETQAQLDGRVTAFYDNWKAAYVQTKCGSTMACSVSQAHYRINYGGDQTVSEAHGYGMLVTVLMAGHDPNAQTIFDGMYHYYRAHPATAPAATRLLAWKQDSGCANIEGASTASDGDLDIAMALLMADRQWGSCGCINYRAEANAMIAQIEQYELDATGRYVRLGNWATSGAFGTSTRSSDFMPSHYRSFGWSTGDATWAGLLNHTYYLVTATAHASTGLLPDFIKNPTTAPAPVDLPFLEDNGDANYDYNACRDPWRLMTDYLASGDARPLAAVQKITTWAKGAPISSNPANVRAGYSLAGVASATWNDFSFSAPFAVGAMGDASNQAFLNSFWAHIRGSATANYYGDSIKMLSMIVITGNWWQPEAMPDPCAVGTPTFTATRTVTRTFTRTVTPSFSRTVTPSSTSTATAAAASPTSTMTPSSSSTPSFSSTLSPVNSATGSHTRTLTPSFSRTATLSSTSTFTGSSTRTSSPTRSSTPSTSASPSITLSPTSSETPAGTLTDSPSATLSGTVTLSFSASQTANGSATSSASPSSSATGTLSPTPTLSFTASETPAGSASATATPSATTTPTATLSQTVANSASASSSPTPSSSATPTRTTTVALPSATPSGSPTVSPTPVNGNCRMLLAYYTSWSKPNYSAADIPYNKLTHICHAFLIPTADGSLPVPSGFIEPTLITQAHANGVKVLVSVGGATGSADFSAIASSPTARAAFAANVKAFILANGYDGVDFDWEFPMNATDRTNFTTLVQAMRNEFNAAPYAHPEWLISGAYSWTTYYANNYDLTALLPLIDFFNVMTYDAHGSWSAHSGHNAPLSAAAGDPDSSSMQAAINYFTVTRGVPANKVNFGLAFYGYDFPTENLHQSCPTCASDVVSRPYSEIQSYVGNGWTRTWDASASSPYLRHDTDARVIAYDDAQSILAKTDYALNSRGLAGVFMWDLSQDHLGFGNQPLLDAMRSGMNCGPTYTPSHTPTPVTFNVPGRIEAEDYANASDSDAGNTGGAYKGGNVDIESSTDAGGGYNLGWTVAGEWMDYQINVPTAGSFELTLRVAANGGTGMAVQLSVDGSAMGAPISFNDTGGWQTWADVNAPAQFFSAGLHTLRIFVNTGGFNLNYLDIKQPLTPTPTRTSTQTPVPPGSTLTNTPTPTQAPPTATWTPTVGDGPLVVLACVPGPNPNPTRFSIHMAGPADEVDLKIYDRSMRCVLQVTQGKLNKGWNQMLLPNDFALAGNGTYFFRIQCKRAGRDASKPLMGRLVVLK